jgi:hypothetical protein
MKTLSIVEDVDVVEDGFLAAGLVVFMVEAFGF